jgi:hypothetical protein
MGLPPTLRVSQSAEALGRPLGPPLPLPEEPTRLAELFPLAEAKCLWIACEVLGFAFARPLQK